MTRLALVALLFGSFALAGETDLERATRLRKEADQDWEAKRHGDAAQKLAGAVRIYEEAEGDHLVDWAVAMRALTWNLMKAGEDAAAVEAFQRLVEGAAERHAEVEGDLGSAYGALWWLADRQEDFESLGGILEAMRRTLADAGLDKMAAQVLHDWGFFACKRGLTDQGIEYYRKAIVERTRIDDLTGRAWSYNNIAAAFLDTERFEEARSPLLKAYMGVHQDGCTDPHGPIAFNLHRVLDHLRAQPARYDKAAGDWLRKVIAIGAESRRPHLVSVGYLQRTALDLASGKKDWFDEAKRAGKLRIGSAPVEVLADLSLCAARAALEAERPKDAARWLKKLDCGSGPVAPHLEARRATLQAWALAWSRKKGELATAAGVALDRWRKLGDPGGEMACADLLEAAIKSRALEEECAAILKRIADLRREGQPGGLGGAASSGGDQSPFQNLKPHDPLFTIRVGDSKLLLTDRVTEKIHEFDLKWQPRNVAINGVSFTLFGGYVTVRSVQYGGGAATNSAPGTATLKDLGDYHPVPARGVLAILKNGAVTYLPN